VGYIQDWWIHEFVIFFQKNVPKLHEVSVLGKIVGYEPMTLTSPTYGLRDQNVILTCSNFQHGGLEYHLRKNW
jgi:hypothetical protein